MPKWRILIADDEPDIRTIVRGALSVKYEIIEAHDGVDALAKLELAEPDFVILDVMMPLMDGFQTCEAIRKNPKFSKLSVLFLSALNSKDQMKRGYDVGANLYLTKPFDPTRLLRNVDLFFEQSPPSSAIKRFSVEEIKALESRGPAAIASAQVSGTAATGEVPSAAEAAGPAARGRTPSPDASASKSSATSSGLFGNRGAGASPVVGGTPVTARADMQQEEPGQSQSGSGWWTDRSTSPQAKAPRPGGAPVPRVLVVDDDFDITAVIRGALEPAFEVFTAGDGLQAIEKLTTYQPDILVMDAMMPKMSGYQLCQSLRRNARFAQTPIIFVSGKASQRDKEYALKIGANDFLAKPFDPSELASRVRMLTQIPGFQILPKTLSRDRIDEIEGLSRDRVELRQDRLHRKEESELEKFVREIRE